MRSILFEGPAHTYLPEIPAYMRFLAQNFPDVRAYNAGEVQDYTPQDFDVMWRFMGLDPLARGRYVVHEYNSLSAGLVPHAKNFVKYMLNGYPDRRVFLNKMVRTGFPFRDSSKIPYAYRDMGIASKFFEVVPKPEYDFVYAGSVHRGPEVLQMLAHFATTLKNASLLVIGAVNSDVLEHYKGASNITFAGRVHYTEVADWIAKGRYGLNLVPDQYPYNRQTATKVLEYCALKLPIVSMKYRWMEHFVAQKDARVFWLSHDYSNLTMKNVESFAFQIPDVTNRRWRDVIRESGVFDFLKTL